MYYLLWWGVYPQPWSSKGPYKQEFGSDEEAIQAASKLFNPEDKGWYVVKCVVIHTEK